MSCRKIRLKAVTGVMLMTLLLGMLTSVFNVARGYAEGDWYITTVDYDGDVGQHASLALDGNENPRISYLDTTNNNLKYAYHDGAKWNIETVDNSGNVGFDTSLALDSNDYPCISYWTA
ncbi:hypothetical protein GTO27_11915, partial [Candidatus Bathyarchaeota archaeon]|nr:hypothetical protein [Candidatus Bathyarchaeota archaeon]